MGVRDFLKFLPGASISLILFIILIISPLEQLLNINRLIIFFSIPIPILINYIAINIRKGFARALDPDYLFLVTHMSSIATGRPPRHKLFELYSVTGKAYGIYSKILDEINNLSRKWGYSYIQAIRHYIRKIRDQIFRDFLARFAEALNMGEDEAVVLETERNIATTSYEARYARSLEVLRILLGIYVASISSVIFININMFIISIIMWGSPLIVFVSFFASLGAIAFLVYAIYKLSPRDKLLHSMKIQPSERKIIAYSILISILLGSVIWTILGAVTRDISISMIALSISLLFPGLIAYRFEGKIKRTEMFFQAFVRSYGLTYSVVKNHVTALRSILRVDLGPLTPSVKRLYVRLSNGVDKKIAWMYFAGEIGSENIRRCIDIIYDTIDSGGDIVKTGIALSDTLLKLTNLREMRRQVARAFQGVVYVLHIVMVVMLEFIIALLSSMYIALYAVAGTGILPFPIGEIDITVLTFMKSLLLISMSLINAIAIKVSEGGYIQTFWLYFSVFLVLSISVSIASSTLSKTLYEMLELEELFRIVP